MAPLRFHPDPAPARGGWSFARALSASALAHAGAVAGSLWLLGNAASVLDRGAPLVAAVDHDPRAPVEVTFVPPSAEPRLDPVDDPLPEPRLERTVAELAPEDLAPVPETWAPLPDWRAALARVSPRHLDPPEIVVVPGPEAPAAPPTAEDALDESAEAEPAPPAVEPADVAVDAVFLSCPKPGYPRASLRLGEEGTVRCRLWIDAAGRVTAVRVVASSGHERLDRAARAALARWTFRPATRAGAPVPSVLDHDVEFRLTSGG